jgi:hypothetical protein
MASVSVASSDSIKPRGSFFVIVIVIVIDCLLMI